MAKPEQVLRIEPQTELKFTGPFNVSHLKLTNPSEQKVMFKVKTTAPGMYCVRPNSGLLDPHDDVEVTVYLQPSARHPSEKSKHKFMVQTAFAPEQVPPDTDLSELWKQISTDKLMDSKLRCVFESPHTLNDSNGIVDGCNTKNSNIEIVKATEEVQRLTEEDMFLQHENRQLMEEIVQLKHQLSSVSPANRCIPQLHGDGLSVLHIVLAIVACCMGLFLGKFVI